MSTNTAQLLAEIPLFSTMDDEERRQIRAIMRERSYQPGQVVMSASDPESSFLLIEDGELEVWLADTDGKKVVLEVLGPGKFYGNLFMHAGETRSASATTSGELVTLEFQVNVKTELEMSTMSERIRDIEQKLHHIHHDVLEARGGKEGA